MGFTVDTLHKACEEGDISLLTPGVLADYGFDFTEKKTELLRLYICLFVLGATTQQVNRHLQKDSLNSLMKEYGLHTTDEFISLGERGIVNVYTI